MKPQSQQVAHGMGIKIVLASGRPLSGVMPFENQLGLEGAEEYAVVFNGAVVQDLLSLLQLVLPP